MKSCTADELTISLIENLFYWTPADIDRRADVIAHDVTTRITGTGFAGHFSPISEAVGKVTSASDVNYSKKVTEVVSSLVRRPIHYQHLLSARKARDALEGHSDGSTLGDTLKLAWSGLWSHLRVAEAALPS